MKKKTLAWVVLCAPLATLFAQTNGGATAGSAAFTRERSATSKEARKETVMTARATGVFDVKISPQRDDQAATPRLSRMLIDKQFHGDLEAASKGQMLAAGSGAEGSSGGYVALEQVSGTLGGRRGAFVLQHTGTMTRGARHLTIAVVPDSGTDELTGLAGSMEINVKDGLHHYDFRYTLPDAH